MTGQNSALKEKNFSKNQNANLNENPPKLHPAQSSQPQYYTGTYMTNPYKPNKSSSSCAYVLIFLFVILLICAILTGIYLTNKVDDTSDGSKTTKELGKLPNKLLNLGKNLIDDISNKLDNSNSTKSNSTPIVQNNKLNLDGISNFANNLFKRINDTINSS